MSSKEENVQNATEEQNLHQPEQEVEALITRKVDENQPEQEVEALSNNKVDVEIEPDVKSNRVYLQICSLSFIFSCCSPNSKPIE